MDYSVAFTLLMFNMCEARKCTDITIINDVTLENVEYFSVSLVTSNLDPTISLNQDVAEIEIIDNDGLCNIHNIHTFYCKKVTISLPTIFLQLTQCHVCLSTPVAVVGLEGTLQVSEDVGVVEVCAFVYSPDGNVPCPIAFPFDVNLSTAYDSAGDEHYTIIMYRIFLFHSQ